MNAIQQAIEALEPLEVNPARGIYWHRDQAIRRALTALRSIPGPVTDKEIIAIRKASSKANTFTAGYRACEVFNGITIKESKK